MKLRTLLYKKLIKKQEIIDKQTLIDLFSNREHFWERKVIVAEILADINKENEMILSYDDDEALFITEEESQPRIQPSLNENCFIANYYGIVVAPNFDEFCEEFFERFTDYVVTIIESEENL